MLGNGWTCHWATCFGGICRSRGTLPQANGYEPLELRGTKGQEIGRYVTRSQFGVIAEDPNPRLTGLPG